MRLLKKCLECKHWMLTWSWVIYSLDFALDGTVLLCCVSILTPVLLRLINWGLKANICIHHLFKVFGAVTHLFYSFEEFHLVMVQQKLWNIYLWWTQHSKHLHKAMLRILLCDVYNVVSTFMAVCEAVYYHVVALHLCLRYIRSTGKWRWKSEW